MKNLLSYLKGTVNFGILITREALIKVIDAHSDANWARHETLRGSWTVIFIMKHDAPVLCSSSLKKATANSTSEAEFLALDTCAKEIIWIRELLSELSIGEADEKMMHQENLGCMTWTDSIQGLRYVKKVGIRYQFVQDRLNRKVIRVEYISSESNKADSLTKILGRVLHPIHMKYLGFSN